MNGPGESSAELLLSKPGVQRVPSDKLELFQLRDFVRPELREQIIALIEKDRRPSTLADEGDDRYFRTSETCDLDADEPAVRELETEEFPDLIGAALGRVTSVLDAHRAEHG